MNHIVGLYTSDDMTREGINYVTRNLIPFALYTLLRVSCYWFV
jgi:hypothetical protein